MARLIRSTACLFLILLAAGAQDNKQGSFTSSSELVLVPAVVTDKAGAPVRGLTAADFKVSDNGKEQKISVFEEVNAVGSTLQPALPQNGIYSNHIVSGDPATTLCIVLIDALNSSTSSQYWTIRSTLGLIENWNKTRGLKQPIIVGTLARDGLRIVHESTSDPAVLIAALNQLRTSPSRGDSTAAGVVTPGPIPRNDGSVTPARSNPTRSGGDPTANTAEANREAELLQQLLRAGQEAARTDRDNDARTTLWALQAVANAVAGIPGRKALIWASSYFPFELRPTAGGSAQWAKVWNGIGEEARDVTDLREQVLRDLVRAGVSVYPVLASGLMSQPEFTATWENDPYNRIPMSAIDASKRARAAEIQGSGQDLSARLLADETAGRACTGTNDVANCNGQATDDAGHYYLLPFNPDPKPRDSGIHKIKLDVRGDHISVRARDHYFYGQDPGVKSGTKEATDFAVRSNLDFLGLPIAVKWLDIKPSAAGKSMARFVIGVDGRSISMDDRHNNHVNLNLGIQAVPGTPPLVQAIDTDIKPDKVDAIRNSQLTQTGAVELPAGNYSIRFVVRDNASGRIGSVMIPLRIE